MEMNFEKELNAAQLAAVCYNEGPSLVIAGAGSGKTRVLTYKIAYLLQQGLEPWSILALTFTNKAAKEMKERIASKVGQVDASAIWMGTFHSVFSKILRKEAHLLGYDPQFTIYDQTDSRSLIKSIVKEMQLDDKVYKPAAVGERISNAKNNLILPAEYARDSGLTGDDLRARIPSTHYIYSKYCERCFQANAMDFDDLLLNTYRLFNDFPEVREKYARKFKFVLVDEYQDTNSLQAAIVWLLTKERRAVCVVGDDAQSIYAFRGANIGNILGFTNRYEGAKIFKLEQNYRSTKMIVDAANSLIRNNAGQIEKRVFSERGTGEPLALYSAYSDFEEGEIVANKIRELRRTNGLEYSDFAILYRTNAQSRVFEEAFRKRSFPYRIYGGLSFYQRKEIKDTIAYFRLISNHNDEEALKRVINYPARGIGDTTLQKIKAAAIDNNVSLWEVLVAPANYGLAVNKGTAAKLLGFTGLIESFATVAAEKDAYEAAGVVLRESGIHADVSRDNSVEGKARLENIEELMNGIKEFVDDRLEEGNTYNRLSDFLAEVSLMSDQDSSDDVGDDHITLMTVHSAKGLEFNTVFIVGLEEELFPNQCAQVSPRELEEERRLFYVAITRAKDRCILTHSKTRFHYGTTDYHEPSRFIDEIDAACIAQGGAAAPQPSRGGMFSGTHARNSMFGQQQKPLAGGFGARSGAISTPVQPEKRVISVSAFNEKPRLQRLSDVERDFSAPRSNHAPLSVGMVVQHDRFGVGEVLSTEGAGENAKAAIKFRNAGVKTLLLKFAKLKIIG